MLHPRIRMNFTFLLPIILVQIQLRVITGTSDKDLPNSLIKERQCICPEGIVILTKESLFHEWRVKSESAENAFVKERTCFCRDGPVSVPSEYSNDIKPFENSTPDGPQLTATSISDEFDSSGSGGLAGAVKAAAAALAAAAAAVAAAAAALASAASTASSAAAAAGGIAGLGGGTAAATGAETAELTARAADIIHDIPNTGFVGKPSGSSTSNSNSFIRSKRRKSRGKKSCGQRNPASTQIRNRKKLQPRKSKLPDVNGLDILETLKAYTKKLEELKNDVHELRKFLKESVSLMSSIIRHSLFSGIVSLVVHFLASFLSSIIIRFCFRRK